MLLNLFVKNQIDDLLLVTEKSCHFIELLIYNNLGKFDEKKLNSKFTKLKDLVRKCLSKMNKLRSCLNEDLLNAELHSVTVMHQPVSSIQQRLDFHAKLSAIVKRIKIKNMEVLRKFLKILESILKLVKNSIQLVDQKLATYDRCFINLNNLTSALSKYLEFLHTTRIESILIGLQPSGPNGPLMEQKNKPLANDANNSNNKIFSNLLVFQDIEKCSHTKLNHEQKPEFNLKPFKQKIFENCWKTFSFSFPVIIFYLIYSFIWRVDLQWFVEAYLDILKFLFVNENSIANDMSLDIDLKNTYDIDRVFESLFYYFNSPCLIITVLFAFVSINLLKKIFFK
jgi:hypothetical protein